jgi:glycosyltransferase involved in cell wall biosynthesis
MSSIAGVVPQASPAPDHPRLSIIVTCFNLGTYVIDALASVVACADPLIETIIVDDGSSQRATIDVLAALEEHGWRVVHQRNKGVASARNAGIEVARGEYVLPLDADNRMRPEYPLKSIRVLDEDPRVGVVYGDCELFGRERGRRRVPNFDLHLLHIGNYIDACAVFRRQIWADVGGYDEDLGCLGHDDWDFWLTVADRGWRFHHIPEIMFDYRVRARSMTAAATRPPVYEGLVRYLSEKHRYFGDHHGEIAATLNRAILEYRGHFAEASRYARSLRRALGTRRRQFLEAERYAKSLEAALKATEAECARLKRALTPEPRE